MLNTTKQKAADAINANTTGADFLTGAATEQAIQAPNGKAIANQIAHLALAGHAVHKGHCGDFTVCKYGLAKYCQNFDELQAFSRKLGVTK
jgi:hypothetical protein